MPSASGSTPSRRRRTGCAGRPHGGLGGLASGRRQAAGRARLVGQSAPRQRPQPLHDAGCAAPGPGAGDRLQFVSLQKNPRPADRHALAAHPQILDRTDALEDFGDTAGLIANLDLTISVDTSVVHWPGRWAGRSGCCWRRRRAGGGCWSATTAHGTLRRVCTGKRARAIGREWRGAWQHRWRVGGRTGCGRPAPIRPLAPFPTPPTMEAT